MRFTLHLYQSCQVAAHLASTFRQEAICLHLLSFWETIEVLLDFKPCLSKLLAVLLPFDCSLSKICNGTNAI